MTYQNWAVATICAACTFAGCKQKPTESDNTASPNANANMQQDDSETGKTAGHHGQPIPLGTARIASFDVEAYRDVGPLTPGKDAAIDVWLAGPIDEVTAVRFWIGTSKGVESIKARADIENPDEPNHWHTHAEIPDPMPAGSQLWVEIETGDQTDSAEFKLK